MSYHSEHSKKEVEEMAKHPQMKRMAMMMRQKEMTAKMKKRKIKK